MIIYGISMQGKKEEIPTEVAEWLIRRMEKYPNVDFKIDQDEMIGLDPKQREQMLEQMKKFSRIFHPEHKTSGEKGVLAVVFPYKNEIWRVKITGGLDDNGNIIGRSDPEFNEKIKRGLPAELRNEIAGLIEEKNVEKIQLGEKEGPMAKVREEDEPLLSEPAEFIPFPSDMRWTSEVSMSGEQFNDLMEDPETKEQTKKALYEKDWDTLRELRNSKMH
jgi:hypothetical protein